MCSRLAGGFRSRWLAVAIPSLLLYATKFRGRSFPRCDHCTRPRARGARYSRTCAVVCRVFRLRCETGIPGEVAPTDTCRVLGGVCFRAPSFAETAGAVGSEQQVAGAPDGNPPSGFGFSRPALAKAAGVEPGPAPTRSVISVSRGLSRGCRGEARGPPTGPPGTRRPAPADVRRTNAGRQSYDLGFALMQRCDVARVVDRSGGI
jgi:hypothetical protein